MALTKQDLQQFGNVVDSRLDKKLKPIEKRLSSVENQMATKDDLIEGISTLGQQISRGFEDQKTLIENAYPSREEFDQLNAKVDHLEDELDLLKKQFAST